MRVALRLTLLVALATSASPLHAQEPAAPDVRFLTQKEATAAIADESLEPYFSLLQPLEMAVKTASALDATELAAQRDECRERYQSACREFTDDEKAAIGAAARAIDEALRTQYPLFAQTPWSFVKVGNTIEGGMPFTHGASVVLPEWLAGKFAAERAKGHDPAKSGLGETLVHEKCHVMQRARPALFADLYVNVWGFVRAKGLPSCPWLEKLQMLDPDGVDVGWVFPAKDGKATAYWQPLVIVAEGVAKPRMPQDFAMIGVALDKKGAGFAPRVPKDAKDGRPEQQFLDQIPAFTDLFGRIPENFHPNETFASMFSWLAMREHLGATGPGLVDRSSVDFTKVKAWCKTHFAAATAKTR